MVIILAFAAIIIGGLVASFHQSLDAANARLVYLAAQAKAIESAAPATTRSRPRPTCLIISAPKSIRMPSSPSSMKTAMPPSITLSTATAAGLAAMPPATCK